MLIASRDSICGRDPIIGADPFRFEATSGISFSASLGGSYQATLLPGPILVFPGEGGPTNGIFGPSMAAVIPEPGVGLLVFSGAVVRLVLRDSLDK